MLQWLRFADATEGFALGVVDEFIDPFDHAFVVFLPTQVVFPCLVCEPNVTWPVSVPLGL